MAHEEQESIHAGGIKATFGTGYKRNRTSFVQGISGITGFVGVVEALLTEDTLCVGCLVLFALGH